MLVPAKRTYPTAKLAWVFGSLMVFISSNFMDRILLKLMTSTFRSTWNSLNVCWEVEFDSLNTVVYRDVL